MTVSNTTLRVEYSPGGSTEEFAVPFQFIDADDLVVEVDEVAQTLNSDYTVSGGAGSTGTVTFGTAPASGTELVIYRQTDITQATDYVENDSFSAETHEDALDKLTLICQELDDTTKHCIRVSNAEDQLTELADAATRANKYLTFDANGQPTVETSISISFPEDDVVAYYTVTDATTYASIAWRFDGSSVHRLVRVWLNDATVTGPSLELAPYDLYGGQTQKYYEKILTPSATYVAANTLVLPRGYPSYKITFEFQGEVYQSSNTIDAGVP